MSGRRFGARLLVGALLLGVLAAIPGGAGAAVPIGTPSASPSSTRVASATRATLLKSTIKAGQQTLLVLAVTREDGVVPRGKVQVLIDGRRAVTLRLSDDGRTVVELRKMAVGVHRIRGRYRGGAAVAPSRSTVQKLTVIRWDDANS